MLAILLSCEHLKGTSKRTKESYDFYNLHFCARLKRFGFPDSLIADKVSIASDPFKVYPVLCDLSFTNRGILESCTVVSDNPADFDTLFFRPDSGDLKPPDSNKSNK